MISLIVTSHAIDDGIETYTYPSALHDNERHCVTRVDDGPWRIAPAHVAHDADLTVDQAKRFFDEVRFLIQMAEKLERERVKNAKPVPPIDAAVNAEVVEGITARGWTTDDAAIAFDMTRARLLHRLGGHSSWTLGDLYSIAGGFAGDEHEREDIFERLYTVAFSAAVAQ